MKFDFCTWECIRHTSAQEISSAYSRRFFQETQRAVKNNFFNIFKAGIADSKSGLKNSSYEIIENVLSDMDEKGALDKMFDRSTDHWTQSTHCMDAFTSHALASPPLMRPVAQIIERSTNEAAEECRLTAEVREIKSLEVKNSWSQPRPWSSSSDKSCCRSMKHSDKNKNVCAPKARDHTSKKMWRTCTLPQVWMWQSHDIFGSRLLSQVFRKFSCQSSQETA